MTILALLVASESLPVVDIDNTIFLQAILFLLLFVVLHFLLFQPWLAVKEKRAAKIGGAFSDAESLQAKAKEDAASYEARLAAARDDAMTLRSDSRRKAEDEESTILTAARREGAADLDARKAVIEQQATEARAELSGRVSTLADEISTQILGRTA